MLLKVPPSVHFGYWQYFVYKAIQSHFTNYILRCIEMKCVCKVVYHTDIIYGQPEQAPSLCWGSTWFKLRLSSLSCVKQRPFLLLFKCNEFALEFTVQAGEIISPLLKAFRGFRFKVQQEMTDDVALQNAPDPILDTVSGEWVHFFIINNDWKTCQRNKISLCRISCCGICFIFWAYPWVLFWTQGYFWTLFEQLLPQLWTALLTSFKSSREENRLLSQHSLDHWRL